jgi:two-component SAPR family response regulator
MLENNVIELAKKLKEHGRNISIIFVTAYTKYALDAFGVDAIGYLLKPYQKQDIERIIEKKNILYLFMIKKYLYRQCLTFTFI